MSKVCSFSSTIVSSHNLLQIFISNSDEQNFAYEKMFQMQIPLSIFYNHPKPHPTTNTLPSHTQTPNEIKLFEIRGSRIRD